MVARFGLYCQTATPVKHLGNSLGCVDELINIQPCYKMRNVLQDELIVLLVAKKDRKSVV